MATHTMGHTWYVRGLLAVTRRAYLPIKLMNANIVV